ncbi:MAG: elongation factor P-like protein YeiP [Planctomycetaceae bacterium]|nr:elongation factor P-like protein YeiP [Planctomycetaceae bacterium]
MSILYLFTMNAKEIKRGEVVVYNGSPCIIEGVNVQSPSARGAATLYKFRARNLVSKQKVDITLKGTESLDAADFTKREVTFSYVDGDDYIFMDKINFEQYSIKKEDVLDEMNYITEDLGGIRALIYNDECVGIEIPVAVSLKVIRCDPGVKGNSATSRSKPAVVQTGLEIQVPEYLEEGEIVRIDTRTGEFLGRG